MSIASGYKKFKKYILTSSGFQLVSHWTKANTLEFDDGKTAQDKLGAIDGISSSRESNSDKIAASTALVSELNSDLAGYQFRVNNGVPEYKAGADAVWVPFKSPELITCKSGLSGIKVTITKTGTYIIVASRGGLRSGNVYVTVSGSEVTKIDHTLANNGGWLWSITSDVYEGMLNTGTTITVTGESKEDGVTAPVSMIVYKL